MNKKHRNGMLLQVFTNFHKKFKDSLKSELIEYQKKKSSHGIAEKGIASNMQPSFGMC